MTNLKETFDPAEDLYVTVAGNASLRISAINRLVYISNNARRSTEIADLGPATKRNVQSLRQALERLEIHSTNE